VAEASGLATTLDEWVLERSCADLAELQSILGPDAYVSVNMSALHLADVDLDEHVAAALRCSGSDGRSLVLEITETALMDDPGRARETLNRLRARGIRIAIDDFGTGYSCLGYLTRLPIDILKIDRSFIERVNEDDDALSITAAIVDLARTLRLVAVAEGVETPNQWALLQRLQCLSAQGFLWSPALPIGDLATSMRALPARAFPLSPAPLHRTRTNQASVTTEHGLDLIMALHGDGASLATIAASLNASGYRAPGNLRWHRGGVAAAISNVVYPDLWTLDAAGRAGVTPDSPPPSDPAGSPVSHLN
jgi:EAL domain-containing protein (putative c-di-GMP-specific phosphodiesterase class I)